MTGQMQQQQQQQQQHQRAHYPPPGKAIRMKVGIMEPVNMGRKKWETAGSVSDLGGSTF
jgi:hypothetical protein